MAEIKLTDGTLLKTKDSANQIVQSLRSRRLFTVTDESDKMWYVNRDQTVFLRDT